MCKSAIKHAHFFRNELFLVIQFFQISLTVDSSEGICGSQKYPCYMRFMQTLFLLSASELLKRTQDLVTDERRATMDLIEHLREIERRMLFLDTGHSSLFEFAVKHLGLSEGSAQRRISAMRLIRDIPEAKSKLESGEISLSNASQVQSVFRASKVKTGIAEKKEILEKISGMTQRECQSALLELVPEAAPKLMERDRQVGEERFELKLIISKELHGQIDELKTLLSHALQSGGTTELLELLVQQEMKRHEKSRGVSLKSSSDKSMKSGEATAAPLRTEIVRSRKYISIALRREIWKRAKGSCEAIDKTGRCTSRYRLEFDHIIPHGQGGGDSFENLRLYCRAHNTKHAIECYGEKLMSKYR